MSDYKYVKKFKLNFLSFFFFKKLLIRSFYFWEAAEVTLSGVEHQFRQFYSVCTWSSVCYSDPVKFETNIQGMPDTIPFFESRFQFGLCCCGLYLSLV